MRSNEVIKRIGTVQFARMNETHVRWSQPNRRQLLRSVRLHPVPSLTELVGKLPPAGLWMFRNEPANEDHVGVTDHALPVVPHCLHVWQPSRSLCGTQVLRTDFSPIFAFPTVLFFPQAMRRQAGTAWTDPGSPPARLGVRGLPESSPPRSHSQAPVVRCRPCSRANSTAEAHRVSGMGEQRLRVLRQSSKRC
jgi:hypothetical protein